MHESHSFNIFGRDERLTCEAARPHLSALVDAELSEQDAAALKLHIASCPTCAREMQSFETADQVLRAHQDLDLPSKTWSGLEEKLLAEGLIEGSGQQPIIRIGNARAIRLAKPIALAAICSIAAAAGLIAGAAIPAMAAIGASIGLVAGFLVTERGDRVKVFAIGASLLALDLGALLVAGPTAPGLIACGLAALPAFAGTLFVRRQAN